ncbi:MAG: hypothetical protein M1491_06775, partial [Deltaproteobacteria bacterium]|nr:hypothetical protein [Deltaproteobacteria bacterium]
FDTAKGNTSGLPAMLPWYSAWTASLSLWKYGGVMGRTPLYRKELCFTSCALRDFPGCKHGYVVDYISPLIHGKAGWIRYKAATPP